MIICPALRCHVLEGNQDESRAAKSKRGDEEAGNSLSALPPSRAGNDNGAPSRTGQDTSGSIAEVPETSLASADVPETNSSATHSAAAAGGAENEAAAPEDDENSDDELPLATFTERNSTVGGGTRINVELRFGKRSAAAEYDVEDKVLATPGSYLPPGYPMNVVVQDISQSTVPFLYAADGYTYEPVRNVTDMLLLCS